MNDILVFSHMMKTAGTSLSKQLIEHYGKKVHIVPGGLSIDAGNYNNKDLIVDFHKKRSNLKVLIGHPIRPYINFEIPNWNLRWFTFLREPEKRYLSHYLYKYYLTEKFQKPKYSEMKNTGIDEWEKIDHCSNYQCKFISGEANAQKAIDMLESKFEWVGITEEYKEGLESFKIKFDLNNLYVEESTTNRSATNNDSKKRILEEFEDFIYEMNKEDRILYDYVKSNIWPKNKELLNGKRKDNEKPKSNSLLRTKNFIEFQIDRQINFSATKINIKSIERFYNRWLKK